VGKLASKFLKKVFRNLGFEVLMAVGMKMAVFF
jgi:hypothetical protein